MNKKIPVLDFLKGYSILTIILYHLFQLFPLTGLGEKAISFGGTGIHTFIFVSGFGLCLSYLQKPLPLAGFLEKRFSRVYLPYIIIVMLSALVTLVIPIYQGSLHAYFGHVFLYKMFDESIDGSYGEPLWFISTIFQLYFLFLPLAWLKKQLTDRQFILTGLIISLSWSFLVILIHREYYRTWSCCGLQFIWEFMLGMACAQWYLEGKFKFWTIGRLQLLLIAAAGLALYALLALRFGQYGRVFNDIPALLGYTALAVLLFRLGIKPVNDFLMFTGRVSYPLYLVHYLILRVLLYELGVFTLVTFALVLAFSYLAAFLLEKVFARISQEMFPRPPATRLRHPSSAIR
jgi:peptidoglycan/LPS O-acetylase OafA/YrhL